MPQRFCPLAFFSFYVNKSSAEAGGCHHCVEHACALWDTADQQCGIKSALDSVGVIADSLSSGIPVAQPTAKPSTKDVKAGMSSLFDKLKGKKRLPSAKTDQSKVDIKKPDTAKLRAANAEAKAKAEAEKANNSKTETKQAAQTTTSETQKIANPALIDQPKNPVGKVNSPPSKQDSKTTTESSNSAISTTQVIQNTETPPPPPPPAPVKQVLAEPVTNNTEQKVSQPKQTTGIQTTQPTPTPQTQAEKPSTPAETTDVPGKAMSSSSAVDEAAKKLAETDFKDDFSDLLNPPPIDVTQLPVVSKGEEKVKDDKDGG